MIEKSNQQVATDCLFAKLGRVQFETPEEKSYQLSEPQVLNTTSPPQIFSALTTKDSLSPELRGNELPPECNMFGLPILLGFPTERWEMEIVASKFERDGLIDYREFVNMLKDKKAVSFESTLRRFLRLLYINSSKSWLFLLP